MHSLFSGSTWWMTCCVQLFDKTCTVVFYCMSLPRGQASDIDDLEWPRYKSKDLATVMFGATSINAFRLANHLPKYHFPSHARNSFRRLETHLEVYSPGVWGIWCRTHSSKKVARTAFGVLESKTWILNEHHSQSFVCNNQISEHHGVAPRIKFTVKA